MPDRVAVLDPDPDHRLQLTAQLTEAGFVVVGGESDATASSVGNVELIVVAADDRLVDELPDLRLHMTNDIPIVVAVPPEELLRIDEITAVGVAAVVIGTDVTEITDAAKRVASGSGYLSDGAMRPVLEEINRLRVRDQERNVQLEELVRRLQDLSINDGLTGLKKHGYFFERLDDELGRALRHRRHLSVVLCDVDDFQDAIEARGRRAGDKMLREVAVVIEAALRTGDVVSRLSDRGFAVLLPETDSVGAVLVADRVREQVAGLVIPDVGRVTVSLGVSAAPEHAIDRDGLLEAAERALYLAKHEGRNTTRTAGDGAIVAVPLHMPTRSGGRDQVVDLLVRVLRLRDPALSKHAVRTADVAVGLGAQMGLSTDRLDHLRVASLLQDVGKIGVPDSILHKRGGLTAEEWEVIQDHPKRGFELVGGLIDPEAAEAVLNNHERWDGKGYPRGIAGEDIPLLARVLLVADAYVAMTTDRTFKTEMAHTDALSELRRNAGSQFDPDVVAAMSDLGASVNWAGGGLAVAGAFG